MRHFPPIVALLMVLSVATTPIAVAGQGDQVTVEISVVSEGGEPVGGADLALSWDGGSTNETTTSSGRALVDVPAGADVTVEVSHPDFVRNAPYVIENASQRVVTVEVARRGRATITATSASGPVENAVVRMFHDGSIVVNDRTDADGVYESPVIEQGEYSLFVFRQGYFRNASTLNVTGNVSRTVQLRSGSVTATFSVTDDHFDPPAGVENASISVEGIGQVSTLANGEATVQVPVNGRFDVTVTAEGYEEVTRTLDVEEEPVSMNVTILRRPRLNVTALSDRVVVGERARIEVVDEYGDPVEGATVLVGGEEVATTGAGGEATFTIESEGETEVTVRSGPFESTTTVEGIAVSEVTTTATATPTATPTPTPTATPTPTPTATPAPDDGDGDGDDGTFAFAPGFTPTAAVLGIALAVLALRFRRR